MGAVLLMALHKGSWDKVLLLFGGPLYDLHLGWWLPLFQTCNYLRLQSPEPSQIWPPTPRITWLTSGLTIFLVANMQLSWTSKSCAISNMTPSPPPGLHDLHLGWRFFWLQTCNCLGLQSPEPSQTWPPPSRITWLTSGMTIWLQTCNCLGLQSPEPSQTWPPTPQDYMTYIWDDNFSGCKHVIVLNFKILRHLKHDPPPPRITWLTSGMTIFLVANM